MRTRGPSTLSRTLVSSLLVGIGAGPLLVDYVYTPTAEQHIRNPRWSPHAKFHNAQYIALTVTVVTETVRARSGRG